MSEIRNMTCICCPIGCQLTVTKEADGRVQVTGNTCIRGAEYGEKELINPTRIVTSTVRAAGMENTAVPVKTKEPIPKDKIRDCMAALAGVEIELPVKVGDIVLENVVGTGVNIVATRDM